MYKEIANFSCFFFFCHLLCCDALEFLPQDNFLLRVLSAKMVNNTSRGRKNIWRGIVGQAKHCLVPWFEKELGLPSPDWSSWHLHLGWLVSVTNPEGCLPGSQSLNNSALHNIFSLHSLVNELYSLENMASTIY